MVNLNISTVKYLDLMATLVSKMSSFNINKFDLKTVPQYSKIRRPWSWITDYLSDLFMDCMLIFLTVSDLTGTCVMVW